ncbi:MAG: hypothetical protein P8188_09055, partial [Gemmatimonadota bacterium]
MTIFPHAAAEAFRNMPIVGRWEVVVTAPGSTGGGSPRQSTLDLALAADFRFTGEVRRSGAPRVRLDGERSLAIRDEGVCCRGSTWSRIGS